MANDIESVKTALEALRDVSDSESKSDAPDLRTVAEKWNAFADTWVEWRIEELRKEENPDEAESKDEAEVADKSGDQLDIAQDETRVVEADEKVVEEKPTTSRRSNK